MASVPPIRAIWCAEPKDPAICGVLFLRVMLRRLTGPFAGLARVQEPGRPGETEDDCAKSGIQARHLHISARKRSGLRHAGKFAYPVKPLNVESLDRPIRAHKKQGNHPAGVIVDMQFPCHSTPRGHAPGADARSACWFRCAEPVSSTVGATCQCRLGILCYVGKSRLDVRAMSVRVARIRRFGACDAIR